MTDGLSRALLVLALAVSSLPACQSTIYEWGPYEESVLNSLLDYREEDLLSELARLDEYESQLRLEDRQPPPGLHAHLGYLNFLTGNGEATLRHFEAEKSWYPESRVFIDGMLERIR